MPMACPYCHSKETAPLSAVHARSPQAIHAQPPKPAQGAKALGMLMAATLPLGALHASWWLGAAGFFGLASVSASITEGRHHAQAMAAWQRVRLCSDCGASWDEPTACESTAPSSQWDAQALAHERLTPPPQNPQPETRQAGGRVATTPACLLACSCCARHHRSATNTMPFALAASEATMYSRVVNAGWANATPVNDWPGYAHIDPANDSVTSNT